MYQYRCRNRQPIHESRSGIPNPPRCVEKPTDPGKGASALEGVVAVRVLVSMRRRCLLFLDRGLGFQGADISLSILADISVVHSDPCGACDMLLSSSRFMRPPCWF